MFKLKANAEELKHILSTMERAHCSIDALFEGIDFDYYLTRQRLENSSSKCYQQVLQPIDDLLKKNGLTESQIDQVILAGAPTKMCKIQSLVKEKFASAKLLCSQSPDEIVALGCAKQCALITNSKIKTVSNADLIFKCLPNPIYLQVSISVWSSLPNTVARADSILSGLDWRWLEQAAGFQGQDAHPA